MIQVFKRNNIYKLKIDILGGDIKDVLFKVNEMKQVQGTKPQVWGRVAMTNNTDPMPDDIYSLANHVVLNDILLLYLGFEPSGPLSELSADQHYVKECILGDKPVAIILIPEDGGSFSFVRFNERDYLYEKVSSVIYLDELQDVVREYYKAELPIGLEKINHAWLYEQIIPPKVKLIEDSVAQQGSLSIDQIRTILTQENDLLDHDVEVVIKYGLAHGLFKLSPYSYGLIVEKA